MAEQDLVLRNQSLQKDVESMQATVKHLQNALDAKSMTIGILSKANRDQHGGDLEFFITDALKTKHAAILKAKDDEIGRLQGLLDAAPDRGSVSMQEVHKHLQQCLVTEREQRSMLEGEVTMLKKQIETLAVEKAEHGELLGKLADLTAELDEVRVKQLEEETAKKHAAEQLQLLTASLEEHGRLVEILQAEKEELQQALASFDEIQQGAEASGKLLQGAEEEVARAVARWKEAEAALAEAKVLTEGANRRAEEAEQRAHGDSEMKNRLEVERQKSREAISQMREYQSKAFELKDMNDHLETQVTTLQEELQEIQHELQTLQADKESTWRAVTEQIDSRVQEIRRNAELDVTMRLTEETQDRERDQQRLRDLQEQVDHLKLKCDKQDIELHAFREAIGDVDANTNLRDRDAVGNEADETKGGCIKPTLEAGKREKVRALREQSQFAFDEMTKRLTEVRAEVEEEKKRFAAEFEQKLKERASQIVQLMNEGDSLRTQVEALERTRDELVRQRDDLNRNVREKERSASETENALDELQQEQRNLRSQVGSFRLAFALQRGVVAPAWSLLRHAVPQLAGDEARRDDLALGKKPAVDADDDRSISVLDVSTTADAERLDEVDEEEDEEEEEEDEDTYGLDQDGQEEWVEMLQTNTLDALFAAASSAVDNLSAAGGDLQDHVLDIVASLDMFEQMYAPQMQELDKAGKGRELRSFITAMQRAMARCQRIVQAMIELCGRNENVADGLQNFIRVKGLEWHLRSLRTAGQHEVLLQLQRNQLATLRTDYEDVLDQYGEQCELNTQLEAKAKELEKKVAEAEAQVEELKAVAAAATAVAPSTGGPQQESIPLASQETAAPAPATQPKGKGKAKGPPPPKASPSGTEPAPLKSSTSDVQPLCKPIEPAEVGATSTADTPVMPKKGKGPGKGPPLPGQKAAAAVSEVHMPTPTETLPADPEVASPAKAKGPGKGKKGPPLPSTKAAPDREILETAVPRPPFAVAETTSPAKAKGKGKGPPPPASKGGAAGASAVDGGTSASAELGGDGPLVGGKGPKGPGKGPSKGGPPGKADAVGSKGTKGKAGAKGGAKGGLPPADPGPAPPPDRQGKKFHWAGVPGNRFATSIFARFVDTSDAATEAAKPKLRKVDLCFDLLIDGFFVKKKDDGAKEDEAGKAGSSSKKKTVATCLDGKKSQAIEIFLNGCGIKIDQVRAALFDLDTKAIEVENLMKVRDFYPNAEEIGQLRDFKENNDPKVLPWGRGEEFLLSLMDLSDFKVRAECCVARGQFDIEFVGIKQDVATLKACLSSIVNSTALPAIFLMVMQIGNFLNFGTSKGAQRGFALDSLPLLTRTEGFVDKSYSLIRFLMDSLEGERAIRDGALEDMKLADAASKLDFEESGRRLAELEKAVNQVAGYVQPQEGSDALRYGDAKFNTVMREFVHDAQAQLKDLRADVEQVLGLIKDMIDLYAEKPKTPSGEVLVKFAAFRHDMEEARRQNLLAKAKKEKAEKKRAEKENAPPKADNALPMSMKKTLSNSSQRPKIEKKEPSGATTPQMKKMNVKIIDRPAPLRTNNKQVGSEKRSGGRTRETSSGLVLERASVPGVQREGPERSTLGPMSKPDCLKDRRFQASGRISVGVAHASGGGIDREKLKALLKPGAAKDT